MEMNIRMEKFAISSFLWVSFLICNLITVNSQDGNNGYIFACPRSLKTGAHNELQLRRFGDLEAGTLKVTVKYQDSYSSNETTAAEVTYDIEDGKELSLLQLYLEQPADYVYNGKIIINGTFGDYEIGGSDKVYFNPSKDHFALIQTDKPIYKEGQTVKFRIMRVNKELKPATEDKADVWVEDPAGTRFFQWKGVSMGKGIKQFEFPLADEPTEGDWKISVDFKGEITTTTFEVKEYVLPKFEVKINIPPFVLADAEIIPIEVCAKYTYGKPVVGELSMNVSLEKYPWSTEKLPTLEVTEKINGCYKYDINVSNVETEEFYRYRRLQVVASVTELDTDVERNETQFIQRQYSPFTISFNQNNQRQFYKPGVPYNGKLIAKKPDDTPAADEGIEVCYTVTKERVVMQGKWKATRTVKFCKNYTTGDDGTIEFTIERQNIDSTSINLEAKSLKYAKEGKKTGPRQTQLSQPQTSMSLTPWYSPSGSFIQLQQVQETLLCGTTANLKVLFTSKEDQDFKFYYQVSSQGTIVHKGIVEKSFKVDDDVACDYEGDDKLIDDVEIQIDPPIDSSKEIESEDDEQCKSVKEARYVPPMGEVDIQFDVSPSWGPSVYVLVYYIREDRETVADSQKLRVEKCFQNQVKMQFGDEVKQPGTRTSIKVTSSPNSLCGIKVVDKSVALLNSEDQLTRDKIFSVLESLDTGMYYVVNHCNDEVRQPGLYAANSFLPSRPNPSWSSSPYEDSHAAFETAGYLVISDLILLTRPCKSRGGGGFGGGGNVAYDADFQRGGAVHSKKKVAMASTARRPAPAARPPPVAANKVGAFEATKSVVDVRDFFPETWLFNLEMTGEDGVYMTKEKLPHTITEWVGSAVCINEEDGLGLSNTSSIKGFQAFFISFTLPYSVIRGESFNIIVSVFSYVQEPLPITLSMDKLEGFEVISESLDGEDICIQPGTSVIRKIKVKGIAIGSQNITVRAETAQSNDVCGGDSISDALAKDGITNTIIVEPEGFPAEDVESVLFCPKDEENGIFTRTLPLNDPEGVVPDSSRAFIDVTGNVLGKSLDNLENLVSLPTGCGEQNMVKFAPNVVAIEVLEDTNQLTDKLKARIIRNLNTGAQRQMQYRHPDGSFSAFGTRDKEGSMFLTAFVLKYFPRAAKYITIDNNVIVQMQSWITSKQQEDGCFPDVGRIFDMGLQGGIENQKSQVPITAYVVAALQLSGYENKTVIDEALSCISGNHDSSFYTTFLCAYAEAICGKEESAKERIESVQGRVTKKGKTEYYHDVNATKSQDVETSAYAVLSILATGGSASEALPIVQYLTSNMNERGGFYSTQDTCVGMESLGAFAKETVKDEVDITVTLTGGVEKQVSITQDERLIVSREKVDEVPSEVNVEATGSGCAVIQKILRYNTQTPPEKRNFYIEAIGRCSDSECKRGTISISTSYIPKDKKTGMAILEVKMITGIVPVKESLEELLSDKILKLMRYDVENNQVVFYFLEITNDEKNFSFDIETLVEVDNPQPGAVTMTDYYNRDITSTTSYTLCKKSDSGTCPQEP